VPADVDAGDPAARDEEWAYAHLVFHYSLIEPCGNRLLLDISARFFDTADGIVALLQAHIDRRRAIVTDFISARPPTRHNRRSADAECYDRA
jgi:DNA-binding GntR family transcriptional regulator